MPGGNNRIGELRDRGPAGSGRHPLVHHGLARAAGSALSVRLHPRNGFLARCNLSAGLTHGLAWSPRGAGSARSAGLHPGNRALAGSGGCPGLATHRLARKSGGLRLGRRGWSTEGARLDLRTAAGTTRGPLSSRGHLAPWRCRAGPSGCTHRAAGSARSTRSALCAGLLHPRDRTLAGGAGCGRPCLAAHGLAWKRSGARSGICPRHTQWRHPRHLRGALVVHPGNGPLAGGAWGGLLAAAGLGPEHGGRLRRAARASSRTGLRWLLRVLAPGGAREPRLSGGRRRRLGAWGARLLDRTLLLRSLITA